MKVQAPLESSGVTTPVIRRYRKVSQSTAADNGLLQLVNLHSIAPPTVSRSNWVDAFR